MIKPYAQCVPVILVGTEAELRDNPPEGVTLVKKEEV